ncbi:hypothetical protein ABIF74_010494 [Bradyrhizobium japonicum]
MERTQIFDLMGELKLYGMKAAFDEIMATAVKRQHEPQRIVGDLLNAEINEKQARSIKYQLTIAKLPLAKDIADFQFDGTPINQTLVNDLADGGFIAQQRNVVLVGGTGTGKTHLAIAVARSCIRNGARGRFYNVVDLVNPARDRNPQRSAGTARRASDPHGLHRPRRAGLSAVRAIRRSALVPSHQSALRAHLSHCHHKSCVRRMAERVRRCQNDHRATRPIDPSLRHRRDRQRQLAIQKPRRCSNNPRSRRLRNPDQLRRPERYQQSTPIKGVPFGGR